MFKYGVFVLFFLILLSSAMLQDTLTIHLRNEFHFSGVHGPMNRSGSHAKLMNPEGVHVKFASDPLRFIAP